MKMTVWFNYAKYTVAGNVRWYGTGNSFFEKTIRIVFLISLYFNCLTFVSTLVNCLAHLHRYSVLIVANPLRTKNRSTTRASGVGIVITANVLVVA